MNNKKSKIVKASILVIVGIVFLVAGFAVIVGLNKNEFVPEETKLNIFIEGNNIILEAHNSQGLEKLMYMWEGKEKYYAQPKQSDTANLVVTIPIPSGENILNIEVTDFNGNIITRQQSIKGATQAEIQIDVIDGYFDVTVTDTDKIESLQYEFNGQNFNVNVGQTNEFRFTKKLEYGQNHIKVIATNSQGIESTKEMDYKH